MSDFLPKGHSIQFNFGFKKKVVNDHWVIEKFNAQHYFGVSASNARIFMFKNGNGTITINAVGVGASTSESTRNDSNYSGTKYYDYDVDHSNDFDYLANDMQSIIKNSSNVENDMVGLFSRSGLVHSGNAKKSINNDNPTYSGMAYTNGKIKGKSVGTSFSMSYNHPTGYVYNITTKINGKEFEFYHGVGFYNQYEYKLKWMNNNLQKKIDSLNAIELPKVKEDPRIPTNCCILLLCDPKKYKKA